MRLSFKLLIATVLALIVILFAYWYLYPVRDGFSPYGVNVASEEKIRINQYSTTRDVIKVYDNFYVDPINGYMLSVDVADTTGNIISDTTATISGSIEGVKKITVYSRMLTQSGSSRIQEYNNLVANANIASTLANSVVNVGSNQIMISAIAGNSNAVPLFLHIGVNTNTYIYTMDLGTKPNISPVLAMKLTNETRSQPVYTIYDNNTTGTKPPTIKNDTNIKLRRPTVNSPTRYRKDTYSAYPHYLPTALVFNIWDDVGFDCVNGSILCVDPCNNLYVYKRPTTNTVAPAPTIYQGNSVVSSSNYSNAISSISFFPWNIITPDNTRMLIVLADGHDTIITSISAKPDTTQNLDIFAYSFTGSAQSSTNVPTYTVTPTTTPIYIQGLSESQYNNQPYNQMQDWMNYWNMVLATNNNGSFNTNDYMLKTQVVPPVCPTCPSCPSNSGVCNSCGGNGGSGLKGASTATRSHRHENGNIIDAADEIVDDTVDLAKDTVKGTVGLAKETVKGTVGLAKETAGGAVGLAKDTVGGAVGLVKDTVRGTAGLLRDVASTPTQISANAPTVAQVPGSYAGGNIQPGLGPYRLPNAPLGIPGIDPYSQYGALPSKGSNFIPITTDFSAFSR